MNAKNDGGWTPLHFSASEGNLEVSRALIEAGADVNAKTDKGRTPLLERFKGNLEVFPWRKEDHHEVARALIELGQVLMVSSEQVADLLRKLS